MYYLEILAVPLPRASTPAMPPGAAIAARLAGQDGAVELRYEKDTDAIRCFLGIPSSIQPRQAEIILKSQGYIFRKGSPSQSPTATCLLQRRMTETIRTAPAGAAIHIQPAAIENDPQRRLSLFQTLGICGPGAGLSMFIRPQTMPAALTALARTTGTTDPYLRTLLDAAELYQAVICTYGGGSDAELLASEATFALTGFQSMAIPPTRVDAASLFPLLNTNPMKHRHHQLAAVANYYLRDELAAITDMTQAASETISGGLRYNPDTIPGPVTAYPYGNGGLLMGSDASQNPLFLPITELKYGTCVVGPVGSGKGNCLFSLITQLQKEKIPSLILEGGKTEYHYLQRLFPALRTWRPEGGKFLWNPFELPKGLTLSQYRPSLHQLFRVAFAMPTPLDNYFNTALEQCYARHGYTETSRQNDPGTTPFGMHEFLMEFKALMSGTVYSEKTRADIAQAGIVRLQSLLNESADLYDTHRSIPVDLLTQGMNLLQLNDLTSVSAKQMFATMVIIALSAYLKTQLNHSAPTDNPRLVIILEESHQLLRAPENGSGTQSTFAEDFLGLMLTLRSVGCCFVLSTQFTDLLPPEFIRSCSNKIFMGDALRRSPPPFGLELDDVAQAHLHLLTPGQGLFTTRKLSRPRFFQTANLIDKILLPTPMVPGNQWLADHQRFMVEVYRECGNCPARGHCTLADRQSARQNAMRLQALYSPSLESCFSIRDGETKEASLGKVFDRIVSELETLPGSVRLCTEIQFLRLFNRSGNRMLPIVKTQLDMEKYVQSIKKGGSP